jgi:endonuclease/exonuclease/phosphatase family metal-dependent hydrolase
MTEYQLESRRRPRRAALPALAMLLVAIAVVVALVGSRRERAEPRSGQALAGRSLALAHVPPRIRVASFNIQSGRGLDGKTDLSRTAALLRSFDLIGLNEAQGHVFGPEHQPAELGRMLELPHLFAASERRWWHDDFGNGLLSRLPVRHWSVTPLPGDRSSGYRNLVRATIRIDDGRTLSVMVTHLDRTTDRLQQLRLVGEIFLSLREPAILMGDLNSNGDDPILRDVLAAAGVIDPIGDTPALSAKERIDWILVRGLRTIDGGVVTTAASDHPLVWAELEVWPSPATAPATMPSTLPAD